MEQLLDLDQLSVEGLHDLIRQMYATMQTLAARVRELEGKLSKNSKNSSNPPSSNGLKKTTSQRKPSENKPGVQEGHEGKTLQRAETPDVVVAMDLPPAM